MPQLPAEQIYNDLSGAECKEILYSRFYDLLEQISYLQDRFALTRVVLRLQLTFDIWGASPPTRIIPDQFTLTAKEPTPERIEELGLTPFEDHTDMVAEVDSRNNPPDLVREEHGLSLIRPQKGQSGAIEDVRVPFEEPPKYKRPPTPIPTSMLPANRPNPNMKVEGKRKWAAWAVQDYGSLQQGERTGAEGPAIGGDKVGTHSDVTELGLPEAPGETVAPVQVDFRAADFRGLEKEKVSEVIQEAVNRNKKADEELKKQRERRGELRPRRNQ